MVKLKTVLKTKKHAIFKENNIMNTKETRTENRNFTVQLQSET